TWDIVLGPGGLQQRLFAEVEGGLAIASLPKAIEVNFRSTPFELILQNQDLNQLAVVSGQLAGRLRTMTNDLGQPLLSNVRVDYETDKPELRLTIDRNRAASLGVSIQDVSRTLQIFFGG